MGRPSGTGVLSSLLNLRVVGSNPGGALVPLEVSISVTIKPIAQGTLKGLTILYQKSTKSDKNR